MKIVTHDGTFHIDEVFAIALLKKFVKKNIEVIRTRDEIVLNKSKEDKNIFVVDVGGEFNFSMRNFDHHQREFDKRWADGGLYSSCGLIWNFLKKKGYLKKYNNKTIKNVEEKLIKKIDSHDNGDIFWSMSNMIIICNREYNKIEDFNKALDLASTYIDNTLHTEKFTDSLSDIFDKDLEKYDGNKIFYSSLSNNRSFLKYLSTKTNAEILIYKQLDEKGEERWSAKAIKKYNTVSKDRYKMHSSLAPECWRGLSGEELKYATKMKGVVFVHKSGFLSVAKNKKTITLMAKEMMKNNAEILVYKDKDKLGNNVWAAQGIKKHSKNSKEIYLALAPEKWRGLSNFEIKNASNFNDAVLVDSSGVLCVSESKKTINLMAKEMIKNVVKVS